jgi:hypothetical protein
MTPAVRKLALTAHVASSVGWLGAAAGFLALAAASVTTQDAQVVRGFYLAMWVVGWRVIIPLCLASLLTGLVMSLTTRWGLFRHYWVTVKFLLTVLSALILLGFTQTLGQMGALAADSSAGVGALRDLPQGPVLHSGGGLLILLINTTLSVYKPWWRTPYGQRKQREEGAGAATDTAASAGKRRRRYLLLAGVTLLLLLLALHLGLRGSH